MMLDLNNYRDKAYKIACEHGFHDERHSNEHWKCLIISELMEAVEADRKDKLAQMKMFNDNCNTPQKNPQKHWEYVFGLFVKDTVEDELADACIRIFDLAGYRNVDLQIDTDSVAEIPRDRTVTEFVYSIIKHLTAFNILHLNLKQSLELLFALADKLGIDIEKHIRLKMEYNASRPYKHGKKY